MSSNRILPPACGHLMVIAALLLAACNGGGGSSAKQTPAAAASVATGVTTLQLTQATAPAEAAAWVAQPSFHMAPVLFDEPADTDVNDPNASAHLPPRVQAIPPELADVPTRLLTRSALEDIWRERSLNRSAAGAAPAIAPSYASSYTPAQIRAAYGLPALPAKFTGLGAGQAAQLGAGQTIYIIDAYTDAHIAAELAAFNTKFGLPPCTAVAIPVKAKLPLAAPSASSCQLSVVYADTSGNLSAASPGYDPYHGWETEIALDVEWAHATAPLARIILIGAREASDSGLFSAIQLADTMGPGVVSMSFGGSEQDWTQQEESLFSTPNMTYVGATGDGGTAVNWPAVSPSVLAVGGTSLYYDGSNPRQEAAWSNAGGGISQYVPAPSYQNAAVPGMGNPGSREVADVSMNADPSTGQVIATIAYNSHATTWPVIGGTSLSTPQWAGLLAVANAERALNGQAPLGLPHGELYQQIAAQAGTYATAFTDVTSGSDGGCPICTSGTGYDAPTGLGTPNGNSLLATLAQGSSPAVPPSVTPATIQGKVGTALTFTVSATASNSVSYSLSGGPSGMVISSKGTVSWPKPVAGTYTITVTVTDNTTALSGSGSITVVIPQPQAPVITTNSITGTAGTALAYTLTATSDNAVTFTMSGAPKGLLLKPSGALSWANPAEGDYTLTVTAKDSKNGLSGSGSVDLSIGAGQAPQVSSASINGVPGVALKYSVAVSSGNPLSYSLSGAPTGMLISAAGLVSWAKPVAGSYTVTVNVTDKNTKLVGQGTLSITIAQTAGPLISVVGATGVAGKAMSSVFVVTNNTTFTVQVTNLPLGMMYTTKGLTANFYWTKPVAGSYTVTVVATDIKGNVAQADIPITVN